MECISYHRPFADDDRVASISGSIMGDEYTDSYFLCRACQVYTVATWHDRFCGEETMSLSGPRCKQEGDERVALIRQCATPWDKRCRCQAHRTYFRGALD
jgi:hypothetical protein